MTTLHSDVVVVGAGPAGLAAAAALAQSGSRVTLLERKPYVGGRAYSYQHPALQQVVDSQHVLLGCCTNLIELLHQAGASSLIRWYDTQTFLEPNGNSSAITTSNLPAPFHYASSFLQLSTLSFSDKLGMARGLMEFFRGYPADDRESVEQWLRRTRQTPRSIRHFWNPILMATLNDNAANSSTRYAGKVFHELFIKSSTGGRLGIPTVPLSDLYATIADLIPRSGGAVHLRSSVESIVQQPNGVWQLHTADAAYTADNIILALPFEQTQRLLPQIQPNPQSAKAAAHLSADLQAKMSHLIHSPFTSILLWYDRQITDLDHAWLLDTTIEWFFHKSRIRRYPAEQGSYVEVIVAGSRAQLAMTREEILSTATRELEMFFPEVKKAKLLRSGILKEARATFSVTPGLDPFRPTQATSLPGLYLAGDWTATDWPSTMEGAVRSGRLAAGAILNNPQKFMAPELPPSGLMSWL